jgi:hypothetical protein
MVVNRLVFHRNGNAVSVSVAVLGRPVELRKDILRLPSHCKLVPGFWVPLRVRDVRTKSEQLGVATELARELLRQE